MAMSYSLQRRCDPESICENYSAPFSSMGYDDDDDDDPSTVT